MLEDNDRMLVELTRSGGFAGRRLHRVVDTAELDEADARRLRYLVASADLTTSAAPLVGAPDEFTYELTVEVGGKRSRLWFNDSSMPESLRLLVAEIGRLARGLT